MAVEWPTVKPARHRRGQIVMPIVKRREWTSVHQSPICELVGRLIHASTQAGRDAVQIEIVDSLTDPSGAVNEDRVGWVASLAWVLDGATDIVTPPLVGTATDADWLADRLDTELRRIAAAPPASLDTLPDLLWRRLAAEFDREKSRAPAGRHEHPSATGIVVRAYERQLDYLAIGDCTLLHDTRGAVERIGIDHDDAGDPWLANVIGSIQTADAAATPASTWGRITTVISANRARMNMEDGYGSFSITPTPSRFVVGGSLAVTPGDTLLLASDGLMRLVDVYRRRSATELLTMARRDGLAAILAELREIETADARCRTFPRAKARDDATGLLVRLV
jgi:hypothetical protein